ncbi:thioredoxin family protein [Rhizobium sp. FKL33]|uniref:thioredoxin family protein n=1 Tax=Rhizobium sp. FKL33 TaxID=2562307 RepID=UPI001FEF3115|nr:thioredoxin family protein [Rhizobium sp. FKL33]
MMMNRRSFLAATMALSVMLPGLALADETDTAIQAGGPVLVHVTAPWCETCQAQKPIVAELLDKPDFKTLRKVDVDFDSQKDVLAKLRVTTQSTMIVFKDGKEIDRQMGQTDPAEIEALFRKAL